MSNLLSLGQWQGFFQYGPEYGTIIEGQEAEFRLFIEDYNDGKFSGRIIDWEGLGVDGEVSEVHGFIDGDLMSFTKQYSRSFIIDEFGNTSIEEGVPGHSVIYEGHFDKETNNFLGKWEIVREVGHTSELTLEEVCSGSWRMRRHD
ncbi:hypothetical protein [Lacibacter sp.]|uniref:hypothetical protein n=1 Tax=Lacibacter sp. TaxID=1915409 RepID=UPI002B4B787F|nr:hypothetical protein [Lacibacter sp.]HLP37962.1 hypothetical protein [Lacibacter sp.]